MAELYTVGACASVVAIIVSRKGKRRKERGVWVRDWIGQRRDKGAYHQLLQELRLTDAMSYSNFLRMDAATFDELLRLVAPLIKRKDTVMRQAIPSGERLALTLRYLATGNFMIELYLLLILFPLQVKLLLAYSICIESLDKLSEK